jgi:DNA repair protein RadC
MSDLFENADAFAIVEQARAYLAERATEQPSITSWAQLDDFLTINAAQERVEVFRVLFLDKKNRLIECREMGRGTIDHCPVYVREIARAALDLDASAVILTHNHPSGDPTPSGADIALTKQIRDALDLFQITTHDHAITGGATVYSMKAEGLF